MTGPGPSLFIIGIEDTGETYVCSPAQNLLRAMERLGREGIPVGCRGGGCGVCKIQVLEGEYRARKMSRAHVSAAEEAAGIGLACRMFPCTDMRLKVLGTIRRFVVPGASAPSAGPGTDRNAGAD